jgi:hypothetical protein
VSPVAKRLNGCMPFPFGATIALSYDLSFVLAVLAVLAHAQALSRAAAETSRCQSGRQHCQRRLVHRVAHAVAFRRKEASARRPQPLLLLVLSAHVVSLNRDASFREGSTLWRACIRSNARGASAGGSVILETGAPDPRGVSSGQPVG